MDEYIKRKDALKICETKIQDILYITDVFGNRCDCVVGTINANEIAEQIKKIPFADVQPVVRGYWKSIPHKRTRVCSRCEADEPYKFADDDANVYDFCPHCGAQMRGEQDEID